MDFLLDTNILIPAEPTATSGIEPATAVVVELLRVVQAGGGRALLHPDAFTEISRDRDEGRRRTRLTLARKYMRLDSPPELSDELDSLFGRPAPHSNDYFDARLLEAVSSGRVDILVTDDVDLHRRARLAGLGERVLTSPDALELARDLHEPAPSPPPLARALTCRDLNRNDPLFDTLREDYERFDEWLAAAALQRRRAWVVEGDDRSYAASTIIKEEDPGEHGLQGRLLKICTFKVSENHGGNRYGELLLKALLGYAAVHSYDTAFVEAHQDKGALLSFLEEFGFHPLATLKDGIDLVYAKRLRPVAGEGEGLTNLEYHIEYGPPVVRAAGVPAYVVPIKPHFHGRLFPDVEPQLAFKVSGEPHGNAIRKAYLCRAIVRTMEPGDLIYFYRSVTSELTVVGVVEDVARLSEPADIVRAAGKRTLYTYSDVEEMAGGSREVLVIGFRQARALEPPTALQDLKNAHVLRAHPQTVTRLGEEAALWLAQTVGL